MEHRHERLDLGVAIEGVSRPRRGEVPPLHELPRGLPKAVHRSVFAAKCRPPQRAPHAIGRIREHFLEPAPERLVEESCRRGLGQDFEERIDAGLDGALAEQVGAERVNGANVCFFELRERQIQTPALSSIRSGAHPRVVQPFPQPELELAGGLLRERDGDDVADVRLALGDDVDDPPDERRRLAGAGRGFDDERRVESGGDERASVEIARRPGTFGPLMASLAAP